MCRSAKFLTVAVALASTLLFGGACGDEGVDFDAPTEEELRASVNSEATGTLDAETLPWVLDQSWHVVSFSTAFLQLSAVYATIFAEADTGSSSLLTAFTSPAPGLASRQSALTYSASAYLSFSCPGENLSAPDYGFENGDARIKSPGVAELDSLDALEDEDTLATVGGLEPGDPFLMHFRNGCRVAETTIGGDVLGVFVKTWLLAAEASNERDGRRGHFRADIALAANRFTALVFDDAGNTYKLIFTHPQGLITSARLEGATGTCQLDVERDLTTGGYIMADTPPDCDF